MSHDAIRKFGDPLISGLGRWGMLVRGGLPACLGSITAAILLSKNSLPENTSVIKTHC